MPKIIIGDSFALMPFYASGQAIELSVPIQFEEGLLTQYFHYDLLEWHGSASFKPWQQHVYLPIVVDCWKKEQEGIRRLFADRKKQDVTCLMKQFAANFLSLLYWLNEEALRKPVLWQSKVECFTIKPVNVEERFHFILSNPNHYQAFVQLEQLYTEIEKHMYASFAVKKKV